MHSPPLTLAPNLRGVAHGFTTRAGGVSRGARGALDLAARPGEAPEALVENWCRVAAALHPSLGAERVALVRQVHGARVLRADAPGGPLAPLGEADGLYTTAPDVVLGVRVADCVPVLFAAPGVVGVAHAGWRGAAAGVGPAVARAMAAAAGCAPAQIVAAIGPCISRAAFEVGDEVVDALRASGVPEAVFVAGPSPAGRPMVDLPAVVAHQLRAIGLTDVWIDGRCTTREPDLWSHRRDGAEAGRFAGVIVRRP